MNWKAHQDSKKTEFFSVEAIAQQVKPACARVDPWVSPWDKMPIRVGN
ncbi:MAG: hypothetical protein Q8Q09_20885 [Deltaproteobacteria bacterium]|nr:hypothetical protein [Deltaproteobacteria bacterium]